MRVGVDYPDSQGTISLYSGLFDGYITTDPVFARVSPDGRIELLEVPHCLT